MGMALQVDTFGRTVDRLQKSEEESEAAFTCLACMQLYDSPVTCIPCGHTFCATCLENTESDSTSACCPECGPDIPLDCKIGNDILLALGASFRVRKEAVGTLRLCATAIRELTKGC